MESTQYSNPSSPAESDATQHLGFGSAESVMTGDEWELEGMTNIISIIARNQDVDVVDGGRADGTRTHEQGEISGPLQPILPLRSSLDRGPNSAFVEVISTTQTNPPKEIGTTTKVQKWMDDCFQSETASTLKNIALVKQLCKDKLRNWKPGNYMTDSIRDDYPGCFQPIIALLIANNVPEAMMMMIDILCSGTTEPGPSKMVHDRSPKSTLLKVLTCCKEGDNEEDELDSVKEEKTLTVMAKVFKSDSQYFAPLSLDGLKPKTPNKSHVILLALEEYVNRSIKLALECRKTIFDVDFANMVRIVEESNEQHNTFLSTEKLSQLAGNAHAFVRNLIYLRCIDFLAANGFDFCVKVDSDEEDCLSLPTERIEALDGLHSSQGAPGPVPANEAIPEPPLAIQNIPQLLQYLEEMPDPALLPEIEIPREVVANMLHLFGDEYAEDFSPARGESGSSGSVSPVYDPSLPRMSRTPPGSSDEENSEGFVMDETYFGFENFIETPPKRRRRE